MRALLAAVLAAAILAGCGGRPKFESPEKSSAQEERDYSECDWEASRATAGLADKGDRNDRVPELIEKCMWAKGYRLK